VADLCRDAGAGVNAKFNTLKILFSNSQSKRLAMQAFLIPSSNSQARFSQIVCQRNKPLRQVIKIPVSIRHNRGSNTCFEITKCEGRKSSGVPKAAFCTPPSID
jgi:hypothetical protein